MKVGDRVEVIFSDGHIQEGQIKSIDENSTFKYCVTVKVFGEDADVYCTEQSIRKIDYERDN